MSYCRFSSDNWKSCVYVYEHFDGGFVTHVAGRKRVFPPIPDIPLSWIPRFGGEFSRATRRVTYPTRWRSVAASCFCRFYALWHRLSMWSVGVIPLRDIGLPHDGDAFSDETANECADRLESLKALGYHVPQYAIDALREEAAGAHP
jgi:hypothetical protein